MSQTAPQEYENIQKQSISFLSFYVLGGVNNQVINFISLSDILIFQQDLQKKSC